MGIKVVSKNRKAFHNYTISETFEAGIALCGTEVKSIRAGKLNLSDGWVNIDGNDEAYLCDVHISPFEHGNRFNHEPLRPRKLLLKRREIKRLAVETQEKGLTIVPLQAYLKDRWVKVEIGVAKGKKLHDKRESKKKQEADRDIARAMRNRR